jgi:penicillin-binding protein-related factor A (putative recombinase)
MGVSMKPQTQLLKKNKFDLSGNINGQCFHFSSNELDNNIMVFDVKNLHDQRKLLLKIIWVANIVICLCLLIFFKTKKTF